MNEWYREAINLRHLVSSFTPALNHEFGIAGTGDLTLFPAVALCHSASLSLYSHHSCAESGGEHNHGIGTPEQLEMQTIALAGILRCCGEVAIPARQVTLVLENGSWYYRESGKQDLLGPIGDGRSAAEDERGMGSREYVPIAFQGCLYQIETSQSRE
ncbi:putative Transcription factor domain-containing protein [Seiridium cardinale]